MHKAEALLTCIALECREVSGKYMRSPRRAGGSMIALAEFEKRLYALRKSADVVRLRCMDHAAKLSQKQKARLSAAHAIAAAQGAELSHVHEVLRSALTSLQDARAFVRDGVDQGYEVRRDIASAHSSVAKVAVTRGEMRTAFRISLRWQQLVRQRLALPARSRDASRMGAALSAVAASGKAIQDDVIFDLALRLGQALPVSPPYDGKAAAIGAMVLDSSRRCVHSNNKELQRRTLQWAEQAENYFLQSQSAERHDYVTMVLRSAVISARSRAGFEKSGIKEALAASDNTLNDEAIASALNQAVDLTKLLQQDLIEAQRPVLTDRTSTIDTHYDHHEEENDTLQKYTENLEDIRQALNLKPYQASRKDSRERKRYLRDGRGDPGIRSARARALLVLRDYKSALEEAPEWSPPNLIAICATARIGGRHDLWLSFLLNTSNFNDEQLTQKYTLKRSARALTEFYQGITKDAVVCMENLRKRPRTERSVPNHRRTTLLAELVSEIIRDIATLVNEPFYFWSPATKLCANHLADWATNFAVKAAGGILGEERFRGTLIRVEAANALLEILVATARHDDARLLLAAMRRDPNTILIPSLALSSAKENPAQKIHTNTPFTGFYPSPTAFTYNVLLRDLLLRSDPQTESIQQVIEDVLTTMNNDALAPDADTADLLLNFFMDQKDPATAITTVQDLYNQFKTRPSPVTFVHFLARILQEGDHHEARRAVYVLDQLWPLDHHTNTRDSDMLTNDELFNLFDHYGASLQQNHA